MFKYLSICDIVGTIFLKTEFIMEPLSEFLILTLLTIVGFIGWYFAIKLSFKTHASSNVYTKYETKKVSTAWATYIATLEKDKENIIQSMESVGMELIDIDVEGNGWGNRVRYNLLFRKERHTNK